MSYFVGGIISEDQGFALAPFTDVRFENEGIITYDDTAISMGEYFFTQTDGSEIKVEYSFGYIRDENGELKINLQHSSLPYVNVEDTAPFFAPVFGSIDDDTIEVEGSNQLIFAGDLNDLVDASTGEGNNRIYAGSGNDVLILGESDRIFGSAGDDQFYVTGSGDNIINGGAGADQFWIVSAELPESANIITDFTSGEDVIGLAGLGIGFEDVSITDMEGDALIAASGSDLAILSGVAADSLTESDFAFG
ncbi:MAG: calcium-binding protein [Cyanobacteria bacterium P01_G01_bin.19]